MRILPVVLLSACAVTACHRGAHAPGSAFAGAALLMPLSEAEEAHDDLLRADIGRADSVAALGFGHGLATAFADDVLYLRGGLSIVRGRAAATAIATAEALGAATTVRWQPVRAEASRDGRSGYSYGYAVYATAAAGSAGATATASTAPTLRVDRYIAFWRRTDAGWRIDAYAETYGAPPAAVALPPAAESAVVVDAPMARARGVLEEVRASDSAFSAQAQRVGTGRAFGDFAADHAQIFSAPGEFITGPRAISESFGSVASSGSLAWHPVAGGAAESGDLAFTVGNATFTGQRADGSQVVRHSKYLTVWKRQRDGSWRYVVDGGSARPTP